MNTNLVSATLLPKDQQAVMDDFTDIRRKLPFLIHLTTSDRLNMAKLGDKTQAFVNKAVDAATQNPELFPAGFLEELRKDAELFANLAPIRLAVNLLQKEIDDTATQVGAEAYAAARTVYAVTKTPFARATLRTAADDLGKRFGRKARATATPPEPPAATPPPSPPSQNA